MKKILLFLSVAIIISWSTSKTLYIQPGTLIIKNGEVSLQASGPVTELRDTVLPNSFLITNHR